MAYTKVLLAWPLMGNPEANYNMVKLIVYNNLHAERGGARGDNLAHQRGFGAATRSATHLK
jgi:hypothetical protein